MNLFQHDGLERNPDACCGNCAYWFSAEKKNNMRKGQCRNAAPKVGDDNYWFPETKECEWCGEHPNFWRVTTTLTEAEQVEEAARRG